MYKKVLSCPNTTLNFIRHLRDETSHSYESPNTDLKQILDLIKSENVELYTPVYMIPFMHQLFVDNTEPTESCVMSEFFKISRSNLSVDYDTILRESLKLTKKCTNLELWEAMSLLTAQSLQVDFLIISNSSLHHLLDHNLDVFSDFPIPYGTITQFLLNYMSSQP